MKLSEQPFCSELFWRCAFHDEQATLPRHVVGASAAKGLTGEPSWTLKLAIEFLGGRIRIFSELQKKTALNQPSLPVAIGSQWVFL